MFYFNTSQLRSLDRDKKDSKMNFKKLSAALVGLIISVSFNANAGLIVIDFEGVGNLASVNDFYNGGTDSIGNSGINYGVQFNSDALGLIDSDSGGSGNTANEPSGQTTLVFLAGSPILNYSAGFDTGFSFFYSSSIATTVSVFDGLNGLGSLLGTINLISQFQDNSCGGDPQGVFCNWTNAGIAFNGIAKSINFGGAINSSVFDDITFGSEVAGKGTVVPEPSTLAIFALGLIGLASRRFK